MAKEFGVRPCQYLNMPVNAWESYQFDLVCFLAYADKDKKDKRTNNGKSLNWLGEPIKVIDDPNFSGIW